MDIFKKVGVKSAFKSGTQNINGQLDFILMRYDIDSNKYLAGTFKNLYSDHRSLFLRIPTDKNVIPFSPPIHDNPWQSWQSYPLIFLLCQNRIMLFIVLLYLKYIVSFIYDTNYNQWHGIKLK